MLGAMASCVATFAARMDGTNRDYQSRISFLRTSLFVQSMCGGLESKVPKPDSDGAAVIVFLLTLLMTQGIPALPGESGAVSGVVRTSAGTPAAGVRVSAMVPPEPNTAAASAASFAALAQTDEQGRYRLEGVPAGRYYIVAGRVDLPTYFPGTSDVANARIFSIAPGGTVSGIDFVMLDTSVRTLSSNDIRQQRQVGISIPVRVLVEDGAKLPVFTADAFTGLLFTEAGSGTEKARRIQNTFLFDLSPLSSTAEYRVKVLNLPESYVVKTMTYGTNDVLTNMLKIPAILLPRSTLITVNGITQAVVMSAPPAGQQAPELNITLATVPVPAGPGVRVRGRVTDVEDRGIYLSGVPGTLYSDGSFEFRGVPPGRHSIVTVRGLAQRPFGVSIIVGDRDVEDVNLESIAIWPLDVKRPTAPGPTGNYPPGTVLAPVSLKGRLLEEASGKPIEEGDIGLIGGSSLFAPIGPGGEYDFSGLLPGSYDLEVQIFGHSNVRQTIVVGDQDVRVDVKTLRLY